MENEKSPHQIPGESKPPQQWYEIDPERLEEEKALLAEYYPGFVLKKNDQGNICWTGRVRFLRKSDGQELSHLDVKVECKPGYPVVFPVVHDVKGKMRKDGCPHIYQDGSLCYGNRLDPQLDFTKHTRVRDVLDYVSVFLGKHWYYKKLGEWPGEHAHGVQAFLNHEITVGTRPMDELCPCGMSTRTYRDCHYQQTLKYLYKLNEGLLPEVRERLIMPSRNSLCPCESGKKFKRCCEDKINYANCRFFLMLKFPKWAKKHLDTLLP